MISDVLAGGICYLVVGLASAMIARGWVAVPVSAGQKDILPAWWERDRVRRAFMLSWFLAWPIAVVVLVVWKVPPVFKRFLWDE